MKLQARFLLLYVFLFGAVALLLVLQRNIDLDRSRFVLQNALQQHQNYFEKVTSIEGQPLETLSVDYSFWDEMVAFIAKRNLKFAHDNIDTGLETYGADMAWVHRADSSLVYFKSTDDDASLQNLQLPPDFFKQLATQHFMHFYLQTSQGLLEVRAATVHPGDDSIRKTTPQGFWIVGRHWNETVIGNLGNLTQSQLKLVPPNMNVGKSLNGNSITFSKPLTDWKNQPVALVTSSAQVPVINDLRNFYNRQFLLLLILASISILGLAACIWWLVIRPMRLITKSIKDQQPERLDALSKNKTEFGSLASTVQEFFRQKMTIEDSEFLKSKLVELNKAKSEFLAIAAHELKSPISNVHVFAENLSDLLRRDTDKDFLLTETERISQQARKASLLINDMYQASKGGQVLDITRTEFDFDSFIQREIEDAQYSTPQKIIREGATGHRLTSDIDRLGQVMTNLLRNASKYSKPSSTIIVRLGYKNNQITVEIEDSGIGISFEDQPKVFNRFFRSKHVASAYPGLGLGLSVCKEIIQALGGNIWLKSEEKRGSHFFFSLPVSLDERELF